MAKRDLVLHNFGWKVLSLFLAALMWMAISTAVLKDEQRAWTLQESPVESMRRFAVPITLLTRADTGSQFTVTPSVVEVAVSGKAADLERLQVRQIAAFVDVTTATEEKLFRRDVRAQAPPEFRIQSVTPAAASVERLTPTK